MRRLREILGTFVKYGFGEIVSQMGAGPTVQAGRRLFRRRKKARELPRIWRYTTWERIRMAVEELGPTFIKLGQILSNRPDLVPLELRRELEKLQDRVPPFPAEEARKVIQDAMGRPVTELFKEFDPEPVAAASLAQVHRALLPGGTEVAVKVQRPDVRRVIDVDIAILHRLAELIARYFEDIRAYRPVQIVEEFRRSVMKELDFSREGSNIERFAEYFEEEPTLVIPRVYRSHTARTVLTMDYIHGTPLPEILRGSAVGVFDKRLIAERGADLVLRQVFHHGFFHGDPHPGNVFVLPDNRICLLDFGIMGSLTRRDMETVGDLMVNLIRRNEQKATMAAVRLSQGDEPEEVRHIERRMRELIDRFHDARAGDFSLATLLNDLVDVLVDEGLQVNPDHYLLIKVLMTIEGVTTALDPQFRFVDSLEPFAERLVRERYDPRRLAAEAAAMAEDYAAVARGWPSDYRDLVRTFRRGRIRFELEEDSLEPLRTALLRVTSAVVFAIVLGALIIGSSVIVHSRVPPLWNNLPVIGIVGFLVAGFVGFWLLVEIIRNRML